MDCEAWEGTLLARRSATAPCAEKFLVKRLSAFLMVVKHGSLPRHVLGPAASLAEIGQDLLAGLAEAAGHHGFTGSDHPLYRLNTDGSKSIVFPAIAVSDRPLTGENLKTLPQPELSPRHLLAAGSPSDLTRPGFSQGLRAGLGLLWRPLWHGARPRFFLEQLLRLLSSRFRARIRTPVFSPKTGPLGMG